MVSTLLILAVALSALALTWSLLRGGHPEIRTEQDWEGKRHEIDLQVLSALLDRDEERYLRGSLSRNQFQDFQRKRIRLAFGMLRLLEENAGMLMRLGQLARMKGNAVLTRKADELAAAALELRLNVFLAKICLALKWLFPSWIVAVPPLDARYQSMMDCLVRIQQRAGEALT